MSRFKSLTGWICLGAMGLVVAAGRPVGAQSAEYRAPTAEDGPLRWQFEAGQKFRLSSDQQTSVSVLVGGQTITSSNRAVNEMTLNILEVDNEGTAQAQATIDRMLIELDTNGQQAQLDTAKDQPPPASLAEIAKLLKPMIGSSVRQRMTTSGKVTDVEVPDSMLPANNPANPLAASMLNRKSLEEMTSRSSLFFPEASPKVGFSWQQVSDLEMGPARVKTTNDYAYLGVQDRPQGPVHVIEGTITIAFPENVVGSKVTVVHQDSVARFYFDGRRGYLVQSELKQDMKLQISGAGQTLEQHLVQTMVAKYEKLTETSP